MKIKFYYVDGGVHPVSGQTYYDNSSVFNGSEKESIRYEKYLAGPISFLVANSISQTDRALDMIRQIEAKEASELTLEGEGVDLVMKSSVGQIDFTMDYDWDENNPEGHFKLSEWKAAFEGWRKFLSMPESLDTVVEVDLGD